MSCGVDHCALVRLMFCRVWLSGQRPQPCRPLSLLTVLATPFLVQRGSCDVHSLLRVQGIGTRAGAGENPSPVLEARACREGAAIGEAMAQGARLGRRQPENGHGGTYASCYAAEASAHSRRTSRRACGWETIVFRPIRCGSEGITETVADHSCDVSLPCRNAGARVRLASDAQRPVFMRSHF